MPIRAMTPSDRGNLYVNARKLNTEEAKERSSMDRGSGIAILGIVRIT